MDSYGARESDELETAHHFTNEPPPPKINPSG
jgi:hypothetical protein